MPFFSSFHVHFKLILHLPSISYMVKYLKYIVKIKLRKKIKYCDVDSQTHIWWILGTWGKNQGGKHTVWFIRGVWKGTRPFAKKKKDKWSVYPHQIPFKSYLNQCYFTKSYYWCIFYKYFTLMDLSSKLNWSKLLKKI